VNASECAGGEPLFVHVGAVLPHKNLPTLAAAFAGDAAPPGRLVLAGPAYSAADRDAIEALTKGDRVEHVGFLDAGDLAALYRRATALVLPTLHEGFGMTVIEAFAAGVPVVVSRLPAIEEVAGDAALLVDHPLDPGAWTDALTRVAADADLRRVLTERGRRRLAERTWEDVGHRWARLLAETG
jgi:glycosyltransferase involved in cell wall biosynthesis